MQQLYAAGFICLDTLTWTASSGELTLTGEIGCKGNIVIDVWKLLIVRDLEGDLDVEVQTVRYAYNAAVRQRGNLLRHDNAHPHPGHPDQHHRHEFDWQTGEELPGSPRWCGAVGWPSLATFVQEVSDWYWEHRAELPEPDAIAELGLR